MVSAAKVNEHNDCAVSGKNELPSNEQHVGTLAVRVYTLEQQLRLGVDESGKPKDKGLTPMSLDFKLIVREPTAKHVSNDLLEKKAKQSAEVGAAVTQPAREMQLETSLTSHPKEKHLQQNQNLEPNKWLHRRKNKSTAVCEGKSMRQSNSDHSRTTCVSTCQNRLRAGPMASLVSTII